MCSSPTLHATAMLAQSPRNRYHVVPFFFAVGIPPPSRIHPTTPQSMCFSEVAKGVGGLVGDADTERREGGGAAEKLGHRHRVKRSRQWRGSVCCCSSPFFGGRFSTAVLMAAMLCRLGDYVQVGISLQLSLYVAWLAFPPFTSLFCFICSLFFVPLCTSRLQYPFRLALYHAIFTAVYLSAALTPVHTAPEENIEYFEQSSHTAAVA